MMTNQSRNWTLAAAGIVAIAIALSAVYLGSSLGQMTRSSVSSSAPSLVQNNQGTPSASAYGSTNQPGSSTSSTDTAARSITVSGTGSVSFVPSEALVSVSVVTQEPTAEGATSSNSVITLSVIKALNSIGISNSSIQTTSYNLSPNYNYNNGQAPPTITSYTVTNSLQVNVTGTGADQLGLRAGQVIDTAVKSGANQVNLQFTVPDSVSAQLSNEALHNAVLVASNQAQVIASSLGVNLGSVLAASTTSNYYPQPQYAFPTLAIATTTTEALTPIVPGTLTLTATVQVTYAIS
jgi:hypothetical protein